MGIYNSVDGTCMPIPDWARRSGPRRTIYYDPRQVWRWWGMPAALRKKHDSTLCGLHDMRMT